MIKTRFAPSPTGELHIGNVRSALFGFLFAKHNKGEFLLRIEDTDRKRFVSGSDEHIVEFLKWLGVTPDNLKTIVYQSKRLDVYKKIVLKLLEEKKAYLCDCSKERLEELRADQQKRGLPTGYDRLCRSSRKYKVESIKDLEQVLEQGFVVRMKMPEKGRITVDDLIRGKVEFDASLSDDQVILKSDGYPTYHLAHIVDDHEMGITDVIRAEEWLPSVPKHIVLHRLLGWDLPKYAHLPMIFGSDKKKLSKRHGATSVMEYKKAGYLPEALINFMAFLGWNPKDERELFSLDELIQEFTIENVNKAPAVFNMEKLNNINEKYLNDQVKNQKPKIKNLLKNFGVDNISQGEVQLLSRGGYKTLKEMAEEILSTRIIDDYPADLLVFNRSNKENTIKGLELAERVLSALDDTEWNQQGLQMELSLAVTREGLANGDVFWPVRVALSGREKSPSPVELLIALGRDESTKRITASIKKIKK